MLDNDITGVLLTLCVLPEYSIYSTLLWTQEGAVHFMMYEAPPLPLQVLEGERLDIKLSSVCVNPILQADREAYTNVINKPLNICGWFYAGVLCKSIKHLYTFEEKKKIVAVLNPSNILNVIWIFIVNNHKILIRLYDYTVLLCTYCIALCPAPEPSNSYIQAIVNISVNIKKILSRVKKKRHLLSLSSRWENSTFFSIALARAAIVL